MLSSEGGLRGDKVRSGNRDLISTGLEVSGKDAKNVGAVVSTIDNDEGMVDWFVGD